MKTASHPNSSDIKNLSLLDSFLISGALPLELKWVILFVKIGVNFLEVCFKCPPSTTRNINSLKIVVSGLNMRTSFIWTCKCRRNCKKKVHITLKPLYNGYTEKWTYSSKYIEIPIYRSLQTLKMPITWMYLEIYTVSLYILHSFTFWHIVY